MFTFATTHLIVDVLGFFDEVAGGVATAGRFVPTTPVRATDTRSPTTPTTTVYTRVRVGADDVVNGPILGRWGIGTATSAVAVIVTGLAGSGADSGFVVALPKGGSTPESSNVNTNGSGDIRANLVVVPVGADGSIDLRLTTTADVLVDIVGSFTDGSAPALNDGTYRLISPTRVVDTRSALGFVRPAAGGVGSVDPAVVPNGALAVSHNIVVTETGGYGYLTAYPSGATTVPVVSNCNATGPGQTRSAMGITVLGGGSVSYYVSTGTHVIVDVTGYFNHGTT